MTTTFVASRTRRVAEARNDSVATGSKYVAPRSAAIGAGTATCSLQVRWW